MPLDTVRSDFNRFFFPFFLISRVDAVSIYIAENWIDSFLCVLSMKLSSLIVCGLPIIGATTVFPVLSGLPTGWAYNSCWM